MAAELSENLEYGQPYNAGSQRAIMVSDLIDLIVELTSCLKHRMAAFPTSTSEGREISSLDVVTHTPDGDYDHETDPCTDCAGNEIQGTREPARNKQLNKLQCAGAHGEQNTAR
jgi:hypothetical protein